MLPPLASGAAVGDTPPVRGARLGGLVAFVALLALPSSAGASVLGPQRVLTVLVTAGAGQPFTRAHVVDVLRQAEDFVRASSFGQASVSADVTPWIDIGATLPRCADAGHNAIPAAIARPLRAAAARAGLVVARYATVVYVLVGSDCRFRGASEGNEILLVDAPDRDLVVHELGHSFGLVHAQASLYCGALGCVIQGQGDPYSPMGTGLTDFSAYEKSLLGWIPPQPRVTRTGRYLVGRTDRQSHYRRALVVETQGGEYWIERRPGAGPPSLLVRVVHPDETGAGFPAPPTLLLAPVRRDHETIRAGETFRLPGAFSARLTRIGSAPIRVDLTVAG
jgi:hypothetical protein